MKERIISCLIEFTLPFRLNPTACRNVHKKCFFYPFLSMAFTRKRKNDAIKTSQSFLLVFDNHNFHFFLSRMIVVGDFGKSAVTKMLCQHLCDILCQMLRILFAVAEVFELQSWMPLSMRLKKPAAKREFMSLSCHCQRIMRHR